MTELRYTHFIITDDHQARLFNIESCETCGSDIEEPNALHARVDPHVLDQLGLTEVFDLLCEGWHDDNTGKQVCENCPTPYEQQERLLRA